MKFKPPSKILNEENYGEMVDQLTTAMNNITLEDNFAGQKISVTLPANKEYPITHNLKDTPKDRIITRQCEEGSIIDVRVGEWSPTTIYLKFVPSGSATECDVTILLTRS